VIPKVGDKYAIVGGLSRFDVSGPFYVTSVRGRRVALGSERVVAPSARREWRASEVNVTGHLIEDVRFATRHAVPWTTEHERALERQRAVNDLRRAIDRVRENRFDGLELDVMREATRLLSGGSLS
jgi:hypothetical protein